MAKTGLKYFRYCVLDGESETLGVGKDGGGAIKADIKIETNTATMYANNGPCESIKEFKGGTITQEVDDLDDETLCDLLGYTKSEAGEITANGDAMAPYVRVGTLVESIKNHKKKFLGLVYMKVQYSTPDESYETKGESLVLKSTTVVGNIMRNKDGDWKKSQSFDTEAEAAAYIDKLCNFNQGGGNVA